MLRVLAAGFGALTVRASRADADPATAAAPVRAFYDVLLQAMRRAKELGVRGRYDLLKPVILATFDLAAMTRISVGPRWTAMAATDQSMLVDAFTRMTIATYANRFDGYSGERFEVDPDVEARRSGVVVKTRLVPQSGLAIVLNYLIRNPGNGWKIVDVYLAGAVSELATRRSEFGAILDAGGAPKLIDTLKQQSETLLRPAAS